MSFFKNLFRNGEPFIATPTQSIPGLEPIVVQAIENLYPSEEDQKRAFNYALKYKEAIKREDTKGLLALLAYSKGKLEQLPAPNLWLDGHFRGEEISPIFPKMKDAEEWVTLITNSGDGSVKNEDNIESTPQYREAISPKEAKIIPILHYPLMGIVLILLVGMLTTLYMVLLDRLFSALSIDGEVYRGAMGAVSLLLAIGTVLIFRRRRQKA